MVNKFGGNSAPWSAKTNTSFKRHVKDDGGLAIVQAADNSGGAPLARNEVIGRCGEHTQ